MYKVKLVAIILFIAVLLAVGMYARHIKNMHTTAVKSSTSVIVKKPLPANHKKNPSNKALEVAAYYYVALPQEKQDQLQQILNATGSAELTIQQFALQLDHNKTKFLYFQTWMDQDKLAKQYRVTYPNTGPLKLPPPVQQL